MAANTILSHQCTINLSQRTVRLSTLSTDFVVCVDMSTRVRLLLKSFAHGKMDTVDLFRTEGVERPTH